jgi:hypothetical protein
MRLKTRLGTVGQISDLPVPLPDRHVEGTHVKHFSPYRGPRECPGRPIANRPQVDNLPHEFFIRNLPHQSPGDKVYRL